VPLHLLFPLFSSIVFVIGMMFAKKAITRGASPWTGTILANYWLALAWIIFGLLQGEILPLAGWWQATLVGLSFLLGQLFTYLAFQHGDVSVATPIFGVKVIIVAVMVSVLAGDQIPRNVWIGAVLAAAGVVLVQAGVRAGSGNVSQAATTRRAILTVVLALAAATSLSLFDVGLQSWGRHWGASQFLPVMFAATGILSCTLLPWADGPTRLLKLGAGRPMLVGTLLMALQAVSMSWSLSVFGDATRINIVYALRGLWAVLLAWLLSKMFGSQEAHLSTRVMMIRLAGAFLLTASVIIALRA
jgi:drug/metabolite transporter (DMT)-like permease